jgi:hypothetical protein
MPNGSGEYMSIRQINSAIPQRLRVQQQKISGTSVVPNGSIVIPDFLPNVPVNQTAFVRLSNNNYVILPSTDGATNIPVFRTSTGDGPSYRGSITSYPWITALDGAQSSQFTNRFVLTGSASQTASTISSTVFPLTLLNVEIAS